MIVLGVVIRHLTKNEHLAYGFYFLAGGAVLILYLADPEAFSGLLPSVMKTLSLFERFYVFVNGVFDLTAIVYFVTFAAFFLFYRCSHWKKGGITDETEP